MTKPRQAAEVVQGVLPVSDNQEVQQEDESAEAASSHAEDGPVEDVEGVIVEDPEVTTDLVAAESLARLATADEIDQAIARLVRRSIATERYKVALLSMTNYRDWYAHKAEGEDDGVPYLAETGAEKVIHAFSINIENDGGVLQQCPPDIGGFEVVYNGRARALAFSDIWYPIVGSRWSDDGFFTRGGACRADPGDVRKAALTNYYNRAIKTTCGLRTITWDELEAIPHLENLRNRVVTIGFESGGRGKGGGSKPGEKSDIAAGPHILVRLAYGDEKNKARVKKMKPWNWNNVDKVWEVKFTKEHASRVADMAAEDSSAVRFKFVNVAAEDLP